MDTSGIIGHGRELKRISIMRNKNILPQAIVFSGISGIGKKKIALRLLADLANAALPAVEKGLYPDILILSPNEKGSIPIGDDEEPNTVRNLIWRLSKKSATGRYGVIIDGIENISVQGQNALLKTLEEPPENTLIGIITANKRLVLPTILSRASEISFKPLSAMELSEIMKANGAYSADAAMCCEISGGSAENALILLQDGNLRDLLRTVSDTISFALHKWPAAPETDALQRKFGADRLLSLFTSCFRAILIRSLNNVSTDISSSGIEPDRETIIKILKLFLSMNRGLSVNMLFSASFKAMLYDLRDTQPS